MARVLVVCTGNLCRSPMFEALLQARLAQDDPRKDWQVSSVGIWAADGSPASGYAIEEMAQRGLDLEAHRSRATTRERIEQADLVLVMTRNHAEALQMAFPDQAHKVHMISQMVGHTYDIHDPFGRSRAEYASVAKELEHLAEAGYERIVTLAEENASG